MDCSMISGTLDVSARKIRCFLPRWRDGLRFAPASRHATETLIRYSIIVNDANLGCDIAGEFEGKNLE